MPLPRQAAAFCLSFQMHMFIARYCDQLHVDISCDGCDEIAPWHRYRCLQCNDMDLCKTCFLGETCGRGFCASSWLGCQTCEGDRLGLSPPPLFLQGLTVTSFFKPAASLALRNRWLGGPCFPAGSAVWTDFVQVACRKMEALALYTPLASWPGCGEVP